MSFRVEINSDPDNMDEGSIHLMDGDEELVMWENTEWKDDPSVVFVIANAINIGHTEGPDGVRARLIVGFMP